MHISRVILAACLFTWLSVCVAFSAIAADPPLMELAHDQGRQAGFLALGGGYGHAVSFSPPTIPWQIGKVRIYGLRFGEKTENLELTVEIWGANRSVLSSPFPYSIFKSTQAWVEIDMIDIVVNTDFTVVVFTRSTAERGIQIGFDSSVQNQHSDILLGRRGTADWTKVEWVIVPSSVISKERTSWMIRVAGFSLALGTRTMMTRTVTTSSTTMELSILSSLDSRLLQITGAAATAGSIILGWIFRTRKRRLMSVYLKKIDATYDQSSFNLEDSKRQLAKIREEILDLVQKGKIDESQFSVLDAKLERHSKVARD